ncbi:hypothetical protein ACFQE1_02090 [Halobium palmae]|uniref:Uncharacterized protein n=1 Tax=Halobium palmae TaxID=1776492 RepID=A0ABD5RV15_9EURY
MSSDLSLDERVAISFGSLRTATTIALLTVIGMFFGANIEPIVFGSIIGVLVFELYENYRISKGDSR